jgi:hypothetical protein
MVVLPRACTQSKLRRRQATRHVRATHVWQNVVRDASAHACECGGVTHLGRHIRQQGGGMGRPGARTRTQLSSIQDTTSISPDCDGRCPAPSPPPPQPQGAHHSCGCSGGGCHDASNEVGEGLASHEHQQWGQPSCPTASQAHGRRPGGEGGRSEWFYKGSAWHVAQGCEMPRQAASSASGPGPRLQP